MSQNKSDGIMYVKLGSYLREIKLIEMRKPSNERLHIPTVKELAKVAGVHPNSISRIVNGYTRRLNLDIAGAILVYMRRCGFQMEISDILDVKLPEDLEGKKNIINEVLSKRPLPPPLTRRQRLKYPGEEFVKAYAESESTPKEDYAPLPESDLESELKTMAADPQIKLELVQINHT